MKRFDTPANGNDFKMTNTLSPKSDRDALNFKQTTSIDRQLTYAEYFAGIGLVRLALEQAGWRIAFANDWDARKFQMYSSYFKDAQKHYLVKDIFKIGDRPIPPTLLATASFPCIDLSLAGNLTGINGKNSSAFWGFIKALEMQSQKPPIVLLENVMGWLTSNDGKDFRITVQALNRLGYACDVFAIDAAHFVPQSRLRVFAIAFQTNRVNSDIETLTTRHPSLTTNRLKQAIEGNRDLNWNFLNIPPLPERKIGDLAAIVETLGDRDSRWWSDDEVQRHLNMMSANNLSYVRQIQDRPNYSYCTMYRRVRNKQQRAEIRKDGIAGCLRTARGGSSRQMLIRAGRNSIKMRLMTPREYARLQGVPDDYPIPSQVNQALTGFGDAVCVPVVRWIAEHILNPLALSIIHRQ